MLKYTQQSYRKGQKFAATIAAIMETINQELTRLRKESGLSQKELASLIGCNNSSLSRIENGERQPTEGFILKILKVYQGVFDWDDGQFQSELKKLTGNSQAPVPDTTRGNAAESGNKYLYSLKIDAKKKIFPDGSTEVISRVDILHVSEPLRLLERHSRTAIGEDPGKFVVELLDTSRDDDGRIDLHVRLKSDFWNEWNIVFIPPLQKGQRASYTQRRFTSGTHLMSAEEIYRRFGEGVLLRPLDTWRLRADTPDDEIMMQIDFPPNFPIELPTGGFGVYHRENDCVDEKERIRKGFSFDFDRDSNQWHLYLRITAPVTGYLYALEWLPPRALPVD